MFHISYCVRGVCVHGAQEIINFPGAQTANEKDPLAVNTFQPYTGICISQNYKLRMNNNNNCMLYKILMGL